MIFGVARIALGGIVLAFLICLIQTSKSVHKRGWYITTVIIGVILLEISSLIPIENAFVTFPSPESVVRYKYSGKIRFSIEGESTTFVIRETDENENEVIIIPKSGEGWKLGSPWGNRMIFSSYLEGVWVSVYQYEDTEDYYICLWNTTEESLMITDNRGSQFYCMPDDDRNHILDRIFDKAYEKMHGKTYEETIAECSTYSYYAYVQDFDENYLLNVDGKTISLIKK